VISRFKLEAEIWVPQNLDVVWSTGAKLENLDRVTPSDFNIVLKQSGPVTEGSQFSISIKPFGLPIHYEWHARIMDVIDTPNKKEFVDIQERGPFLFWKHKHSFERGQRDVFGARSGTRVAYKNPGTWVRERVEYSMPLNIVGQIGHALFMKKELERVFAFRRVAFAQLLNSQEN
jgi:ligand-binding SRPBCC domain-containing protein